MEFQLINYSKTALMISYSNDAFIQLNLFRITLIITGHMLRNLQQTLKTKKNSIQRIVEYIDHHYYEDINRSILADMVYLSADHLARIFKKETGETLVKYITDKRINAAKSLLSQTNISISQVSCQVGYDNYSYFTKIFKQRTGLSPGDYRKTYQNKM